MNIFQRIFLIFRKKPTPEFIASQLRKPAGKFAGEIAEQMNGFNEPLFMLTLDTMKPAPQESLLEIGFGSGIFFERVLSRAEGLQVKGLDFSPEMVRLAEANNPDFIKSGQLRLEEGASNAMPFDNQSFHKVFCNNVVYFWENPGEHLAEIHRVLKPGGKFYAGIRAKSSMEAFPPTQFGFTLYEPEGLQELLEKNGFSDITISRSMDPPVEIDGKVQTFESVCVKGIKTG